MKFTILSHILKIASQQLQFIIVKTRFFSFLVIID